MLKKSGNNKKNHAIKNLLLSIGIIIFFVSIILIYYNLLYAEKRDAIIKEGQLSALQTADRIEDYLAASIEAVELTSYTMEKMLADGASRAQLTDYLVGQTTAVTSTVFENTTGMYAYAINGDYVDGAGWVPDKDYDPTTRPWYTAARKNGGKITLIDPYLDKQTNTIMMSLAKMLSDGVSVVSMDINLNKIQEITENAVEDGNLDHEVILDSKNMVVAHSDKDEVGVNYNDEKVGLWAKVMEKVNGMDEGYTEVSYNGEHYIIYNMILNSNWRCVTVRNATSTFKPLFVILITTIAVVILVIIVLSYIMYNYTKRFYIADNLNKQLSAIANTFYSLYDIDILNDKFSLIKSSLSTETADPDQQTEHAREALIRAANQLTSEISRPEVLKFIDFDTLNHRLKKQDTIAEEFLSSNNVWCRARFVVAKRNGDGSINHVLWIVEGIDEEKRRRDQLIDMSEKAFAESKAKSDFLSNMSHEIRTPINAVLGMNEMILRESNEANIIGYSESIKSSGNTLLSLINDILDFSKIESGKIDIVPVDYDLSSVINDLAVMIRSRADEKGIRLCFDINPDTPKRLNGDEVRIKQIITNILTNAVKYTEKGTVTLGVDYQDIDTEPDSVFINVEVKDTGIGIKKEDMDKLFVEYERIEVKRNRHIEGTGLGLSITKGLLELMGSSLKAESIYGLGSKFSFSLKQKVIAREPLGDYEADFEEMRKKHDRYKEKFLAPDAEILVVDDNQMNLSVFKNLLKKTRIKIDTAESGNEGLALMKKKKYDVIFLDHMMPRKDGIETLQDLKSDKGNPNTETPVICLTANAIAGIRDQYLAAGFDDYISKPVDPEKLEEMLIYYLPDGKVSMEDV